MSHPVPIEYNSKGTVWQRVLSAARLRLSLRSWRCCRADAPLRKVVDIVVYHHLLKTGRLSRRSLAPDHDVRHGAVLVLLILRVGPADGVDSLTIEREDVTSLGLLGREAVFAVYHTVIENTSRPKANGKNKKYYPTYFCIF